MEFRDIINHNIKHNFGKFGTDPFYINRVVIFVASYRINLHFIPHVKYIITLKRIVRLFLLDHEQTEKVQCYSIKWESKRVNVRGFSRLYICFILGPFSLASPPELPKKYKISVRYGLAVKIIEYPSECLICYLN